MGMFGFGIMLCIDALKLMFQMELITEILVQLHLKKKYAWFSDMLGICLQQQGLQVNGTRGWIFFLLLEFPEAL